MRAPIFFLATYANSARRTNLVKVCDLPLTSLGKLLWLFSLSINSRAASIHLRDMISLEERIPELYTQFCDGMFTLRFTGRRFSRMPIDEGHEHNNAMIKGDGGAVGLTENPSALQRWMVSGEYKSFQVIGKYGYSGP